MAGLHIYPDEQSLIRATAERIVEIITEAQRMHGEAHIALAGGSTPGPLYELLASYDYQARVDWRDVHCYFGDERCVPPTSERSNFRMINELLLARVAIPADHIHRIAGESDPVQAVSDYRQLLGENLPKGNDGLIQFDLILLGIGTDGHTASLFPDTEILNEQTEAVAAVYVEKLKEWRISLTLPVINRARHVLFLAAGAAKASVVDHYFNHDKNRPALPVASIKPRSAVAWYIDRAAAAALPQDTSPC